MYIVNKNIIIIILLVVIFACDEPAPIEINNVEEEVEVNIINSNPNSYVITGYDSTGIIEDNPLHASVISVSGIKNTVDNLTVYRGYGEAVFFDTTKPVLNNSDRFIGFKTFDYGTVKFGNMDTRIVPYFLRFRENSDRKDTLIGVKHTISYQKVFTPEQSNFPYNRDMKIEITNKQGNSNLLNIRLPDEIFGNVEINGDRVKRNLKIILTWEKSHIHHGTFPGELSDEIIVGGISKNRDELIPLFRLSRLMKNRFEIPNSFVKNVLSSENFEYIVFTFLRKIRKSHSTNRLGDIHFASQSIHNIWIKI